ncbi:MAG TPA: YbaK/EbsC family protein [Bryobacteraceae bacterium]|nr:YbaK/EbsC family protein [Bryobacteraceae bacterium]
MHVKVSQALQPHPSGYRVYRHADFPQPIQSPAGFAAQLGYPLQRITKTLLVRSNDGRHHAVLVASMGTKLDFSVIARELESKRIEVAPASELLALTGYPQNGVSPLGIEDLPVFMEEGLFAFNTILVGAGEAGIEIEIDPKALLAITRARRLAFVRA